MLGLVQTFSSFKALLRPMRMVVSFGMSKPSRRQGLRVLRGPEMGIEGIVQSFGKYIGFPWITCNFMELIAILKSQKSSFL